MIVKNQFLKENIMDKWEFFQMAITVTGMNFI